MSIVIFIAFKEFVPSGLVVSSAIFDIVCTVGVLNIIHHPVSVAGIGALLMLIGYSVDTDVLLTNRLIKEKDSHTTYWQKFFTAFKTGQLMLTTTFVACSGAYLLSNSVVIKEIALIIIIGLVIDSVSTWIQNAGMLFWWLESKGEKLE
jgi:preprotein translocase subunit SecF